MIWKSPFSGVIIKYIFIYLFIQYHFTHTASNGILKKTFLQPFAYPHPKMSILQRATNHPKDAKPKNCLMNA